MSDHTYSIIYAGAPLSDDLSMVGAVKRLLNVDEPLHRFEVICCDESVTEEDGTHPIHSQKRADEFLHDIYKVDVDMTGSTEAQLLDAAEEAVRCIAGLTP